MKSAKSKKYTAITVPMTHWDRAWYFPFQIFRMKLVSLVDQLLDILKKNKDYKCFVFDGQAVPLEDYLEIKPENKGVIKDLVKKGKLHIGPFYVLPDEFIISPESFIRNIMLGMRICDDLGGTMKVGYIPDPFGHISQLPMILKGFGLNSFIFTRGAEFDRKKIGSEFIWQASDGESEILTIYQVGAYGNACVLGYQRWRDMLQGLTKIDYDLALDRLTKAADFLKKFTRADLLLLNNGVDHQPPQPELAEILKRANKLDADVKYIHGSYQDYVNELLKRKPKLDTLIGEMRAGKYQFILTGVSSSRMYLKLDNEYCQNLYERWVEPTSAIIWLTKGDYPHGLIWRGWKYILQNHPHDDICGCSVDQVHRDMEYRYDQARLIGERLVQENFQRLVNKIDLSEFPNEEFPLVLFNPHGHPFSGVVSGTIRWEKEKPLPKNFVIKDENGELVPYQKGKPFTIGVEDTDVYNVQHTPVWLYAKDLPAFGYKTYCVEPARQYGIFDDIKTTKNSMENSLIKVSFNKDGSFNYYNKKTRQTFRNWNTFEDQEDAGDEYDWSYCLNSKVITSSTSRARVKMVDVGPAKATAQVTITMKIPEALVDDRKSRSKKTVPLEITSFISIYKGSSRVDVETRLTNNAKDHRLRALFPTNIPTDTANVDGHFDVIQRNITIPKETKTWKQPPIGPDHQRRFLSIDNGKKGVTLINTGLGEYEVIKQGRKRTLALTLLRSVGWLSRGDFATRSGHAGPALAAPEGQCLRPFAFHYAIFSHSGNWHEAQSHIEALKFNVPAHILTGHNHKGTLAKEQSFVNVDGENVVLSAVKRSEKRNALVVRLFNYNPKATRAKVKLYKKVKNAYPVNLNEDKIEDNSFAFHDNTVEISLKRFQVKTVSIRL